MKHLLDVNVLLAIGEASNFEQLPSRVVAFRPRMAEPRGGEPLLEEL